MTNQLVELKLLILRFAVQSGTMTPEQAMQEAIDFAESMQLPEAVIDALKGQPPVIKGGE
jgi:hypothetical protein